MVYVSEDPKGDAEFCRRNTRKISPGTRPGRLGKNRKCDNCGHARKYHFIKEDCSKCDCKAFFIKDKLLHSSNTNLEGLKKRKGNEKRK